MGDNIRIEGEIELYMTRYGETPGNMWTSNAYKYIITLVYNIHQPVFIKSVQFLNPCKFLIRVSVCSA